jgi:hypothetical protein
MNQKILERLAENEHEQWCAWASSLMSSEPNLSEERIERWETLLCEYKELPLEKYRDKDRMYAREVLRILKEEFNIQGLD